MIDARKSEKPTQVCISKENTEALNSKNESSLPASALSQFTISSDQKKVWDDVTRSALSLSSWNEDDVCAFLKEIGLERYEQVISLISFYASRQFAESFTYLNKQTLNIYK